MIIHSQIQGCVARNCHPIGCRAAVQQQIERIKAAGPFNGPKRVLVLGASSGFGLASRIALAFGAGADTITLGAADGAAQTLKYDVANQSTTTAWDKVSNFQMVATNGDLLNFAGTTLLTSAQLGTGWTVSTGIATKTGATVADFIAAAAASTTAGVVAFSDGTDTYVAYSDGTAATTTSDQVVELVGLIGATSVSTTVGANVIGII